MNSWLETTTASNEAIESKCGKGSLLLGGVFVSLRCKVVIDQRTALLDAFGSHIEPTTGVILPNVIGL